MKKVLIIYILCCLAIPRIFSQQEVSRLTNNLTENIILTTDREIYLSGEKVWFRAQGFIALDIPGKQLSDVLYVELFNSSGQSYVRKKYKVANEVVSGMFEIPRELNSGNYFIRAYTQYLRNSIPETFSTYPITIINPSVKLPPNDPQTDSIEILPEFGFIMGNLTNKVVVRFGSDIRKEIKNAWLTDGNNQIADISLNNGMGLLQFTPLLNVQYLLYVVNKGDTLITKLPMAQTQGTVVTVNENKSDGQVEIKIMDRQSSDQSFKLELLSSHFNKIAEKQVNFENGEGHTNFAPALLNTGFNYFILRNNRDEILKIFCHYKSFNKTIALNIIPDKQVYSPREKIELGISPPADINMNDLNVTVSVVKKGSSTAIDGKLPLAVIRNPILLESYLESNPEVNDQSVEVETLMAAYNYQLDHDINLKENLAGFQYRLEWVPEIRDVSLSGYIVDKESRTPVPGAEVYASIFKTNPQVHLYTTDDNGFFIFSLNNLTETQDVFLNINKKSVNDKNIEILVNNDFLRYYPKTNTFPLDIDSTKIPFIEDLYVNYQASRIFKTETGTEPEPSVKLPFSFENPEFSINLDDYVENPNLETVFRELVPSVKVRNEKGKFSLTITDMERKGAQANPLIMVDFITIFDENELMAINPAKIQKIDIYTTPFLLGNVQINGVILVTTKTDNFGGMKMPTESAFFEYTTLSNSYSFNPPVYETDRQKSARSADFRNLLYWNANLNLKNNKKLTFYASDHCSKYDIIVKGTTRNGQRYFGKKSIEVVN